MGLLNLFQTVTCAQSDASVLERRSYGIIEVQDQELKAIHLRPFPKIISSMQVRRAEEKKNRNNDLAGPDRILLYYNQPRNQPNFLALKYFVSDARSSLATIAVSLSVLDFIAKVKKTDAIVTDITNDKIQDRHLEHFGWERHMPDSCRRHWIKRYYGEYPARFLFMPYEKSTPATEPKPTPVASAPGVPSDLIKEQPAQRQPLPVVNQAGHQDSPWANTRTPDQLH